MHETEPRVNTLVSQPAPAEQGFAPPTNTTNRPTAVRSICLHIFSSSNIKKTHPLKAIQLNPHIHPADGKTKKQKQNQNQKLSNALLADGATQG